MNLFFRILLACYAFCISIASFIVGIMSINKDFYDRMYISVRDNLLSTAGNRTFVFIISLSFFIISVALLFSGVKRPKERKCIGKHTDIGEILISMNSLENIALNTARRFQGVKDIKARVFKKEDHVNVSLNMVVFPDISIPSLSHEIQSRVRRNIEDSAGVQVGDVKIYIDGIQPAAVNKPRVE